MNKMITRITERNNKRIRDWHLETQDEDYLSLMRERIDDNSRPLIWCEQFANIISDLPHSNQNLIINDIGCNVGHFCRVVCSMGRSIIYNGYDISGTYVELAKKNFPDHMFYVADISRTEPLTIADVSIVSATLEHIRNWKEALKNIYLSTRNVVLVRSFFGDTPAVDMLMKAEARSPYIVRRFSFSVFASHANLHGFKVEFIRDRATDSIPTHLGGGIVRTQYVAKLTRGNI